MYFGAYFALVCLFCGRFEMGKLSQNNGNVIMFLFYGFFLFRSNKDLQITLKLYAKMKRLLVCKRTPKISCTASRGIFTNYNSLGNVQ